jgi:hypothetical protein
VVASLSKQLVEKWTHGQRVPVSGIGGFGRFMAWRLWRLNHKAFSFCFSWYYFGICNDGINSIFFNCNMVDSLQVDVHYICI